MEKLKELIKKHVPELKGELVDCNCGAMLLSADEWAEHVALEIAANVPLKEVMHKDDVGFPVK